VTDYIICVRSIENGRFGDEPGATYFLEVPPDARDISVEHRITRKKAWFDAVLASAGSGDILVFIHGYNNSPAQVLAEHRRLKRSLDTEGFTGEVVSFDWPSGDNALSYLEDRSDAKKTAIKLVDDCITPFCAMQEDACRVNTHLLAHSSGAYVVREAFDDADDRPKIAASNWMVSQIMFIAADVSARSLGAGNPKSASLYRHCVRLTNYSNPYDSLLKLSNVKRLGTAPRAGRVGLPPDIPENAVNVNCGRYCDEHQNSHSWYIGDPHFTKDMFFTLQGDIDRHSIPTRKLVDQKLYLRKEGD